MNKQNLQKTLSEITEFIASEKRFQTKSSTSEIFFSRLGSTFESIYSLYENLYGGRDDFHTSLRALIRSLAKNFILRNTDLKHLDSDRERNFNWFLSQKYTGMALYADRFAENIPGLLSKLDYFDELGVNLVHLMPVMDCPREASDGGYAVRDFKKPLKELGTIEDIENLSRELHKRNMLLTLDVVLNHTSDQHEWAMKAKEGDRTYEDYFYTFDTREETLAYEEYMPEIFPETSPGSFTFNEKLQKWVMTVFNDFQWDLNYSNPEVFLEMINIILFYANTGADILRLDAVAYLWKQPGTTCQNLPQAHVILQLIKACAQVAAPGVLFIAEAIVAPEEVIKYLGNEDENGYSECDIAYNATFMALLWDGVATKNAKLIHSGLKSLPQKPDGTTWLNYLRCHDDIGLGFSDEDIEISGYNSTLHRKFLIDYFTRQLHASAANGVVFGENKKTGDARIAGTLASLIGLDEAIKSEIQIDITLRINQILMLHSLVFAFGGIPLLYYGDEIGTPNYDEYIHEEHLSSDSRWIHRPLFDWKRAERRKIKGTVEERIFSGIKNLNFKRKDIDVFSDMNKTYVIELENQNILGILRCSSKEQQHLYDPLCSGVLALANFAATPQFVEIPCTDIEDNTLYDLCSGKRPQIHGSQILMPPFSYFWLTRMKLPAGKETDR